MDYRTRNYLLRLSSDHHRFNGRWSLVGGNGEFTWMVCCDYRLRLVPDCYCLNCCWRLVGSRQLEANCCKAMSHFGWLKLIPVVETRRACQIDKYDERCKDSDSDG
jgi:hypothetical protein